MAATNFPLWDELMNKYNERSPEQNKFNPQDKERIISTILSATPEQSDQIALILVHHYFLKNPGSNPFANLQIKKSGRGAQAFLPYGIKIGQGGGLSFELDQLPGDLIGVLKIFCGL